MIAGGRVSTDLTDSLPVTVEITVFAEEDSFFETEWAYMEIGPEVEIRTDGFRPSVTGTLTNPTDQPVDLFPIECLLVDADDNVITEVSGYGDRTAPGQTIAWELSGSQIEAAINAELSALNASPSPASTELVMGRLWGISSAVRDEDCLEVVPAGQSCQHQTLTN